MLNLHSRGIGDGNPSWRVYSEPTTEPLSLSEIKIYSRIDGSAENSILEAFISAVRKATENYLGRALISQTLVMSLDYWPGDVIRLPMAPLISVTEVRTVDEDDIKTTYASSNYYVRPLGNEPGELVIRQGFTYPQNTDRDRGGYEIEWLAGFGASADDVPGPIREAMKVWVAMVYENRVPLESPPDIAKTMMNSYRVLPI